jgi:GNAT superfamily N-acetyltransferase
MKIRKFKPSDQNAVTDLIHGVLAELGFPFKPQLHQDLQNIMDTYGKEGCGFWVAEVKSQTVGTAGILAKSTKTAQLKRMYVISNFRCQGIGTALLNTAESFCRHRGYKQIQLDTHERLKEAIIFYQKRGFEETPPPTTLKKIKSVFKMRFFKKEL